MRSSILIGLIFVCVALASARAEQPPSTSESDPGPTLHALSEYRLGMTLQEIQTMDGEGWRESIDTAGSGVREGRIELAGMPANALLAFNANTLYRVRTAAHLESVRRWPDCLAALVNLANDVEAEGKLLNSPQQDGEGVGQRGASATTTRGSEIRTYGTFMNGLRMAIAESADHSTRVTAGWRAFILERPICYVRAETRAFVMEETENSDEDFPFENQTGLSWLRRPDESDISRYFPSLAEDLGLPGNAELTCTVQRDNHLDCRLRAEQPIGWNFGDAAIFLSRLYEVAPKSSDDGSPTAGRTFRLRVRFVP